MSVLEAGKWMCMAAIAEAMYAACIIPGAWPTVAAIGLAYSDPGQMDNAGNDWKATAGQMNEVATQLDRLAKSVPEDKWQEGGRESFQKALDKYKEELGKVHQFTDDVGGMLKIAGYAFFAFAVLAFAIGTMLAVWATSILAASWTIVGGAALEAAGNAVAGVCDTILSAACVSLKTAMMVTAGIIAAGMGVYMYSQSKAANPTGSGPVTFQQASIMPTTPNVSIPQTS
ncbi:hypothetical protein NE236_15305 [Actinoallomurus purpureus]|uniref:WXG100 family type VII secretion target n=1 Tax=Actinoallomurus purpureus TaxID=478114 RepID=UPI002092F1DF|nr:hypothetical protein [Actinoallomurus purpureus]MCO6006357.1 hypothetical protein [Actinoallomurus purpureus]